MLKSELIQNLAVQLNQHSVHEIANGVNVIIDELTSALSQGGRIEIRGFGSFSLHYHAPRHFHNPKTGQRLITKAKYCPHFKPGKKLRALVNEQNHSEC